MNLPKQDMYVDQPQIKRNYFCDSMGWPKQHSVKYGVEITKMELSCQKVLTFVYHSLMVGLAGAVNFP